MPTTSPETVLSSILSEKATSLEELVSSVDYQAIVKDHPSFTTFKNGGLYYAVISDIHLGHKRNAAARIVDNLYLAFPDNAETASLDIIFIAGDIFDDVLMFNDEDIDSIKWWSYDLLCLCKKHNIKLRILKGTPGHDREQSKYFVLENEIHNIGADLKYIEKLEIEYMEDLDLHILYVPDELPGGAAVTLEQVKDLIRWRGLTQVDFAIMHGLFKFQIPFVDALVAHDEAEYLALVKHNISIGHDHTHKEFDRIYVQGSFDRLGHGYESPKGHMRFKHRPDGSWEVRFIENIHAMRFDTLTCTGMSLEDTLEFIREAAGKVPDNSHIRVRAESNHPIFTNMDSLTRMAPLLNWAKDPQRDKEKPLAPLADTKIKFVPITITRENISGLILERLANEGASGATIDAAIEILEELFPSCKTTPQSITQTLQTDVP